MRHKPHLERGSSPVSYLQQFYRKGSLDSYVQIIKPQALLDTQPSIDSLAAIQMVLPTIASRFRHRTTDMKLFESKTFLRYPVMRDLLFQGNIIMKRFYLLAIVLFAITSSAVLAQDTPRDDSVSTEVRNYMVVPGDKIEGKVLGEDQFSFLAYVDENGNFSVPFDEEPISAKCRTEMELRTEVTKRVAKYVRNPMVSVYVSERRKPMPVTVSGEVVTPGGVELRREARLLELIAFSGGVNDQAGGTVRVIRPQPPMCAAPEVRAEWLAESDNGEAFPSRMYTLSGIQTGVNESNPIIFPGDIILVEKASPVYINGEISNNSGVLIKEGGLSLTQAIAKAGGVREKAKIKEVLIYRKKGNSNEFEVITANLKLIKEQQEKDVMLEPYDIIDIGTKKQSIGEILLQAVLGGAKSGALSLATGGANRVLY